MRAQINGIDMHYVVSGAASAPAVVLHHPLATNLSIWDELTAALEPHYRVVRFDARGHGASEAPKGPYRFDTLAGDVIALMDHLSIAKARFVGLSMGGMVGQHLGLDHAARFDCLSLVSTASEVPAGAAAVWDERIRLASSSGMASVVEGALARWLAPEAARSRPDLVSRLSDMIRSTPVAGYVGWCEAIRSLAVTSRLKTIRVPTQVIVGVEDPATPPAAARLIHDNIAGSELIEMPGVSHMLQVEAPAAFHRHLLPFLANHGPTP